jgi:CheY-like chemotaxis protein
MRRLPVSPLIMRGLQLAEERLGLDELARRLDVALPTIEDWRTGLATMPESKFLQLIDIVVGIEPAWQRIDPAAVAASAAKRILVVDDNADAAFTLAQLLEALGHQASAVSDPRQATALARELRPQLALIDLNMPHLDGLQLARLFRQDPQLSHVWLVALTAMDGKEHREMTRQAGFDAHLRKPADPPLLRSIIGQFLDR